MEPLRKKCAISFEKQHQAGPQCLESENIFCEAPDVLRVACFAIIFYYCQRAMTIALATTFQLESCLSAAMPPSDFQKARDAAAAAAADASSNSSQYLYAEVDGRPYFPTMHAKNDPADEGGNNLSILRAAVAVVLAAATGDASSPSSELSAVTVPSDAELVGHLTVGVVSGGITNSLYRVSGLTTSSLLADALPATSELKGHDSVLVRVFGTLCVVFVPGEL
jgi:hypothetical protein